MYRNRRVGKDCRPRFFFLFSFFVLLKEEGICRKGGKNPLKTERVSAPRTHTRPSNQMIRDLAGHCKQYRPSLTAVENKTNKEMVCREE